MTADHEIVSVTVTVWNAAPVTYLAPLSFEVNDGLVVVRIPSTSMTPRQDLIYPISAVRNITLTFG
jgi:hypothetical protein